MSDVIPAPESINPSTIDFNALHAKAMAFGETPEVPATPAIPAVEAQQAEPVVVPEVPVATPSTPQVLDLPDEALVKIKVDGVEQTVSVKDYRDGIQREASYTKRMQTLANQRKEAENVFAQKQAELSQQAQAVAYMQRQLAEQTQQLRAPQQAHAQPVVTDPNEIATVGEVQQALAALQQNFAASNQTQQQQFMAALDQAGQKIREEQATQADALKFTSAMNRTLESADYKILREVLPFPEDSLRYQVAQLDPQTMDEAIDMMENIAKEWATKVKATSTDYLTRQEVAKARAKMEPSTGTPVPMTVTTTKQASFMKKDGKLDWDALRARAQTLMDS